MDLKDYNDKINELKGLKKSLDKEAFWESLQQHPEMPQKRAIWKWILPFMLLLCMGTCYNFAINDDSNIGQEASHNSADISLNEQADLDSNAKVDALPAGGNNEQATIGRIDSSIDKEETKQKNTVQNKKKTTVKKASAKSNMGTPPMATNAAASSTIRTDESSKVSRVNFVSTKGVNTSDIRSVETQNENPKVLVEQLKQGVLPLFLLAKRLFSPGPVAPIVTAENEETKSWQQGIRVYGGPGVAQKRLEAKVRQDYGYAATRKRVERGLEEWHFGLAYELSGKKLFLRLGTEYTQYNDRFSFREIRIENENLFFEEALQTITILSDGSLREEYGWVDGSEYTQIDYTLFNQYRSLDIPISVGYRINKNSWAIEAEAGVALNALFSFTGHVFDKELALQENPDYFVPRTSLHYLAGVSFTKAISEDIEWSIGPHIRVANKSITDSDYALDQWHNSVRLRTGFKYQF